MNEKRLSQLQAMKAADPSDPFLPYAIAQEYVSAEMYPEAYEEFSALIAAHPDYLPAYHHLGLTCYQLGELGKAADAWTRGLALAREKNDLKTANEIQELLEELMEG